MPGIVRTLGRMPAARAGQRLMVIMPHPDDECFTAAGTMARYAAEGATVSLVTVTRGGAGLWQLRRPADRRRLTDVREGELRHAAAVLGVGALEVLDYPDGALDKVEAWPPVGGRLVGELVRCVRAHRPQVVITFGPEGGYGHPDHQAVSRFALRACTDAADPSAYSEESAALGLEAWTASRVYFASVEASVVEALGLPMPPRITARIDIRKFTELKRQAFACHRTQSQEWEPFNVLLSRQPDVEVFSLRGAANGGVTDDLF
jgi:LmbE family N-acetylglucosaminyl deacetylase